MEFKTMTTILYSLFPSLMLMMFGGLLATWIHLSRRPDGHIEDIANRAGWILLSVYFVWMVLITLHQGQIPAITFGQLAVLLGFLIWADQSYLQMKLRQGLLVLLPIGAVILLLLVGVAAGFKPEANQIAIRGIGVAFHVALSLAGVAMLLGAGGFGAGVVMLHRQIAHRTFGQFFANIPSMQDMQKLRAFATYWGWLLITISLVSAFLWVRLFKPESNRVISHLHPMLTLWAVVSLLSLSERFKWLGQYRLAWLSVILAAMVMLLVLISVFEFFAGEWI
jgi:ABC-type uncharacterized transport system permease subunit